MISGVITFAGVGPTIQTAEIDDLAITTGKLAADAVTAAKLADDAVVTANVVDLNVTTGKIAADAITADKLADDSVGSEHIEDLSANLTFADAVHIVTNASNGTQIATNASQKVGFHGTSVIQANHIVDPDQTGIAAADVAANALAINAILVVLENKGLTAAS